MLSSCKSEEQAQPSSLICLDEGGWIGIVGTESVERRLLANSVGRARAMLCISHLSFSGVDNVRTMLVIV